MNRFIACVMSVVLVVGLMPLPSGAAAAQELHVGTALETSTLSAQGSTAVGPANATITDKGLYEAVTDQLDTLGIQYGGAPYDSDKKVGTVELSAEDNVRFTRLDAAHRHIQNIDGLEQFTALTWVNLSNNLVKTSSQFAGMKDLSYLDLYDNAVRDLDGLRGLAKLEHLNLGDNDERNRTAMTNLNALSTLTSLKWFDFSRNQTPEVTTHIKDLTALEHLNLIDNNLKDIFDLAGLVNVKELLLNHNSGLAGISAVKNMPNLEELHVAFTHLNRSYVVNGVDQYGQDKSGINELFDESGKLKLTKLRKIDLLCDWNTGFATDGTTYGKQNYLVENGHIQTLYDMFRAGQLEEFGYFYTWFDVKGDPNAKRTPNYMHTDPVTGVKYITYEDFDAHCDGVRDDYYAIFNAHMYANTYGCEVRSTINAADAPNKTFHIFNYYTWRDLISYTNIDWQNANFVIHDEDIDHYPSRHFAFLLMFVSPQGATSSKSVANHKITIENKGDDGQVLTFTNDEGKERPAPFTLNPGTALNRQSTSFAGLNPQFDAAMQELRDKGYNRFYVMVTNENKRQYRRHEGLDYRVNWEGYAQWDAFTVAADGTIEQHNASTTLPYGENELSNADYHSPTPTALQWDFDGITKVEIIPIPDKQSYVKNARFVTNPLASQAETPRDGGGKPADYRRCLDFRYCTNLEVANITQTLGTAETGWDHNELSGSYYGFFTMSYCADIDMHDCASWDRRTETSSYGLQLSQIVNMRLTRVSSSNPNENGRYVWGDDGDRWGNTGCNYMKHILYDHCTLGRIDAHMGYYDLAVRDCNLGRGGLCLTGQGPLTVERTATHSSTFMNLRSDYGSTWDGDAHINDCTHYIKRSEVLNQPPHLSSSTPRFDDYEKTVRHDFGYPLRHPNLYIRNFTVDNSRSKGWETEYGGTYGILSNYLNGLEKYDDYWPDVVDIDGFNMVNYEQNPGYERHVRLPLKMAGPAAELVDNYSIRNVRFDGKDIWADFSAGDELAEVPFQLSLEDVDKGLDRVTLDRAATADSIGNRDIVIEYEGDEPDLAFSDVKPPYYGSDEHWIVVHPYYVEHHGETHVAYFSSTEINQRWSTAQTEYSSSNLKPYSRMVIRATRLVSDDEALKTDGATKVLHAQLLATKHVAAHDHKWDLGKVTKEPKVGVAGERTYTCAVCGATKTEEIAALPVSEPEKMGLAKGETAAVGKGAQASKVEATSATQVAYVAPKKLSTKTVSVPNVVTVNGKSYKVTSISTGAFAGSKAATVIIGNNVRTVEKEAFKGARNLKFITIGKSVKTIGKGAFAGGKKQKQKQVTIKTSKLSRSSFKNMMKGSKIKALKLTGVSKKARKNYSKWAKAYNVTVR